MPAANGRPPGAVWAPAAAAVRTATTPTTPTAVLVRGHHLFIGCLLLLSGRVVMECPGSAAEATPGGEAARAPREPGGEATGAVLGGALGGGSGQWLGEIGEHHLLTGGEPALDPGPGVAD